MTENRNGQKPSRSSDGTERDADRGEQDAISRNLKRAYEQVANEPLPDTLASLLEKLKKNG